MDSIPSGSPSTAAERRTLIMSTIAPPPKPANPVLVDSEGYIDQQIRRTRRSLKLLDLAAGTLTLLIGLLAFVLVGALIDHWIVPGGLSDGGRLALFGLMLAGVAWYGWRQFVPLLKPINPVYAAQTIERNTPTLKNSLLNLLLFRSHRDYLSARVYHALEQQTAVKLSSSEIDGSLDRSALLRLGYVLLGVIAVFALYAVLSPKSLALSTLRVINPLSEIAAPSRVQIQDVKPGKTSVARGERVEVSAEIHGLGADEPVRLRYSTADERTVDESIRMERPSAESRRFEASLPRGTDAGVEQDLSYWIEAGDARTRKFKLTVFTRPTLIVQKVHYAYPPYTGLPTKETNHIGDIRGVEGTMVTIGALASQKIKSAYIDFDADGTSDKPMKTDGDRAMVTFPLELRDDHRTPVHAKYVLRFTAEDGRQNVEPPVYTIEVTPDYAPEVSITEPQEPEQVARLKDVIPIGVEARDPDYGLKSVTIFGKVDDAKPQPLLEMIDEPQTGRVVATKLFTPGDAGLKPGDVLEYWAVAHDGRPEPNIGLSEHHRLKIIGPDKPQQGNPQQRPQQGAEQPNKGEQGGENGESGSSGVGGGQGSDSSEGGSEGEQQSGGGGSSGEGKQGESGQEGNQGQDGAGGSGGGNESGDSPEKSDQTGENGGDSSGSEGEQSENDASQDGSQGSGGGASGQKQQPKDGQSPSDQGGESGEAGGKDSGEAGGQGGKVSSEGDEDATAMQRIMEQWNKNNPQQDGQGKPGDQQQEGKQTGEAGQAGQPGESKGEQQGAEGAQQQGAQDAQQQPNQGNNLSRDAAGERSPNDSSPNNQQQGANGQEPKEGEAGEGQQTSDEQGKQPPGGSPQSNKAAGQGQQGSGQQPQAEGAQPQGPGEQAGDQQQQGAGSGQNPSKREGANQSREAKPGDGAQEKQDGQPPSPDSAMNQSGGDSGAGHSTGKEQGAPGSDDANRQGTKKNQEDNRPGREDNEAPVGSPDKKESDSQGGLSGEQSGGGKEGGGQKADAPGKGGPGQHEPADEGAGRAQEQGEGETGTQAGDQQKAEGQTGQSSGDQAGNGSKQGEAGESKQQQPGEQGSEQGNNSSRDAAGERSPNDSSSPNNQSQGNQQGKPGEQGSKGPQGQPGAEQQPPAGGEQGEQSGEQQPGSDPQGQQGDQGQQPGSRDAAGERSPNDTSPNNQPQGDQPNDQQSNDRPSSQNAAGSAPPMGGGTGSAANSSSSAESGELGADQANLDYAREQTNLVLEGLDQQLAKKQVDRELLKNLGWTEAELQRFVDRWKSLKERAAGQGEDADNAKQELDDTLGSLGIRKDGPLRFKGQAKADDLRANDALRVKPPSEYADRVREYTKGISSQRKD